jgi:hypothetical protein
MGAETWTAIAREFGIPAAFAVCFMAALGVIGWQCIKGVKWLCTRLVGDGGILTTVGARHIAFMDSIEATDAKHSESLSTIAVVMDRLTKSEDERHIENAKKLDAIKQDTEAIRQKVVK